MLKSIYRRNSCSVAVTRWRAVKSRIQVIWLHRTRFLFAGLRNPLSSPKSKTYSPPPALFFPARPAISTSALPPFPLVWTFSALRISGKVGSSSLSMARGLSFHHFSAVAANRLLLVPKASPAVNRALGSHFKRPLKKITVSGEVLARNLRSRLSARPDASPSLRQRMSSGHPIADSAAWSSGVGEPRSLVTKDSCSIGVSPVRHGAL